MNLEDKIKEAERTLKLASEMSEYYYHKPLIICYSGGKDSDVMLDIAKKCLKPNQFEVLNAHTTLDAPDTVYHIRKVFAECEKQGIHTQVLMPTYKGKPTSMWRLIEEKLMPPTRTVRYCCQVLKETSTPNRMAAVGVREDESTGRRGRSDFAVLGRRKADGVFKSTGHTYAMFKLDKYGGEDAYQCQIIKACKDNKDTIVNPIYKFTNYDIWEYVNKFNVPMNPLYAKGYKRVGCIGCPMGGANHQRTQFADYPKYKENYIKAFDRMVQKRKEKGLPCTTFTDGEAVMTWWLNENPKQIKIDELLNEKEK